MRHEIDASDPKETGRVVRDAAICIYSANTSLKHFPGLLKQIIWAKAWEKRETHGRIIKLNSLRELITQKQMKGWGLDIERVRHFIIRDPEALEMFDQEVGVISENTTEAELKEQLGWAQLQVETLAETNQRYYSFIRECDLVNRYKTWLNQQQKPSKKTLENLLQTPQKAPKSPCF